MSFLCAGGHGGRGDQGHALHDVPRRAAGVVRYLIIKHHQLTYSVQVDTEGVAAKDTFYVTYHGEPLGPSMTQLVTNALQYYLSLYEVEKEESY